MKITNPWIGYVTRTYEQIRQNVLTEFQNLVPEITDHTDNNPWVKGIGIWSGITEMTGYYIDRRAREIFLSTAVKYKSASKIAQLFDYRIRGKLAATVDVRFYFDSNVTANVLIPEGTEIQTKEGIKFLTTADVTILSGTTEITVSAKQWTKITGANLGVSDFSQNQSFVLEQNVVDNSLTVFVDVTTYTPRETFAYSIGTDEHYVNTQNENKEMIVKFGDGINGKIPPNALAISSNYYISEGLGGNVTSDTITVINSSITPPSGFTLKVNNTLGASGGSDEEGLKDLKKNIPLAVRTKYRAVTEQDFIDIAELAPGVERAGVVYQCGKFVDVYIVPNGGGIASNALLISTFDFMEERKIITTKINVFSAGEVVIKIVSSIQAYANFLNSNVKNTIEANLLEFGLPENQKVKGSVQLGDVYEVIEGSEGVNFSKVEVMTPIPYARPIEGTTTPLDWVRSVNELSSGIKVFKITFTGANIFELIRDSIFIGSFSTGVLVETNDVNFTINSSYVLGDIYEFKTYNYFGTVVLDEPSIPVFKTSDMTLNVTGGIV